MRWTRFPMVIALLAAVSSCQQEPASQPDKNADATGDLTTHELAAEDSKHARILLENDYVLVAEFDLAPGERIPPHYARNRAVYALSDYRLAFDQEGFQTVAESDVGDLAWYPAGTHSVKNTGETDARFLVVMRKLSRLFEYSFTDDAKDYTCLASGRSEVLLENEYIRVARFTLAPGDAIPLHRGYNRVMFALTDYDLRYRTETGATDRHFAAGEADFYPTENHAVSNQGTSPAVYLMFELRQ